MEYEANFELVQNQLQADLVVNTFGPAGKAATIEVGTTTTGEPGTDASVENVGTETEAILNFTIPQGIQGEQGESATVTVGTTTTGEPGTNASVTNSGTSSEAVLDFTIPRGNAGQDGYSPTATVTKSGDTATISITDTNGTTTATVTDGSDADVTYNNVIRALGYTPYDSSNPDGYTSNIGTVTSVNGTSPDSNGNVSLTIPTVNNATLTIQKNGTTVDTFTANASSNVTCNITVPTQASDIGAQATLVSGTNIKTINNNSILGSGNLTISGLPSQSGNSGKFLTTNGTNASWATATKVTFRVWS